jgi:hypothetical protein
MFSHLPGTVLLSAVFTWPECFWSAPTAHLVSPASNLWPEDFIRDRGKFPTISVFHGSHQLSKLMDQIRTQQFFCAQSSFIFA